MPSNVSGSIDPRVALPVQQRPDLTFAPRLTRHGRWWTVKDPLSLQYFQLRDEELFVLKRLDGRTSAAAILRDFRRQFAPLKIGMQELTAFVLSLAERGLVTVGHRGLSHRLDDRRQAGKRRRRWTPFANPLAIRFRGIDPQAMLDRLYPAVRWMFSRTAMIVYLLTIASALMLIFARWDEFQMRIPATSSLFATRNLLAFAAAVGLIKILHELGHAFACRHFGGECRELGVMLLAFVPCLYCNVSDTWLLSNRWHRIAVSAAGIGVELVLAAICTFLWWYSEPGLLHSLCFSVMFVASAGTLLINGNPLLRYDGYHILTDLLDTPNLRQRASAASRRYSARWLFGVHEPDGPFLTRRWRGRLALFGVASSIYLWVVLFVILRFLDQGLEPYGLRPLVVLLALLVVGSRLAGGSASAAQRVRGWHAAGLIRPIRFGLGLLFVGGLAGAAVLLPLPHRIAAPCVVAVRDPRPVYVTVPGRLTPAAHAAAPRYGDVLADGEVIARLNNYDVERDVVRLEGECHQRRSLLTALRRSQKSDAVTAAQLRAAEAELRDFEGRLAQRREDRESLTLTSPGGGVLLPPADAATRQNDPLKPEGAPLDDVNEEAYFETGTVIGVVGTPGRFDALLAVDEIDIPHVRPGQIVRLRLPQLRDEIALGTVTEIASRELEVSPQPLVESEQLPSRVDEDGTVRPARPVYEVRVVLENVPESIVAGAAGQARIEVGRMTLARRVVRYLEATFVADR